MARNIDQEAGKSYSWLGDRFKLVKTCRVNAVVAFLIVAFFAGALSSIIFLRALDVFVYGD
jgi:hypothetical protein